MQFEKVLNKFVKFFYFCGLSCYPSFDAFSITITKQNRLVRCIPSTALILLIAISSTASLACQYLKESKSGKSVFNFVFIYSITLTVTLLPCAFQMIFLHSNFATIYSHISTIGRLTWGKYCSVTSDFQRHFMRRVYIIVAVFLIKLLISMVTRKFSLEVSITITSLNILRALTILVLFHAAFYIDLLNHMLECFVRHIESRTTNVTSAIAMTVSKLHCSAAYRLTGEILHFKLIHFHLWEISEKINLLFGWTICITFLQYFVLAIYNVYSTYRELLEPQLKWARLLRECSN